MLANLFSYHWNEPPTITDSKMNPHTINGYILGMFLRHRNSDAGEPDLKDFNDLYYLAEDIGKELKDSLAKDTSMSSSTGAIPERSISQIQQIGHDYVEEHLEYKREYFRRVFSPLDDYFSSVYGFTIDGVIEFVDDYIKRIDAMTKSRFDISLRYEAEFKKLGKKKWTSWINRYFEDEEKCRDFLDHCEHEARYRNSAGMLVIDPGKHAYLTGKTDKKGLLGCLNAFSCGPSDQFDGFGGPLSDNIIHYKPIIRMRNGKFFFPFPAALNAHLDQALEYLLAERRDDDAWEKFVGLKSDYLRRRTFELISDVFPDKHVFENLYCETDSGRYDTGTCVIYDNKIIIVGTSSISLEERRSSGENIHEKLVGIVADSLRRAARIREYAGRNPAEFHATDGRTVTLKPDIDYEFFYIDVTLDHAGMASTCLKSGGMLDGLDDKEHAWSVSLHDLEVAVKLLDQPIYFIHYLIQRHAAYKRNVIRTPYETAMIGYYVTHGSLDPLELLGHGTDGTMLPADEKNSVTEHANCSEFPPEMMPADFKDLLLNMQKYYQRGFTDVTSALLDFSYAYREAIVKNIRRITSKLRPNEMYSFSLNSMPDKDIGMTYVVSYTTTGLHKHATDTYKSEKQKHAARRWVTIGRNITDRKNLATFFIYDDTPADPVPDKDAG